MKKVFIILAIIISVSGATLFGIHSVPNKAIRLGETVTSAKSSISIQEKRRVDLIYNLVDCVKSYDKHESEVIKAIADSSKEGIKNVTTAITTVTKAYPELKSDKNYARLMTELATTENMIANYRENYNNSVTHYNSYVKKFPTKQLLSLTGYEVQNFEKLTYETSEDAPKNLFGE